MNTVLLFSLSTLRYALCIATLFYISSFSSLAHAEDEHVQVISSGAAKVSLIELYTSEGCSSCPRADRWLSRFVDNPLLWREIVLFSFHVDYWNYLGWRDEFSSAVFSQRQREHKRVGNLSAVYTPGVLINGFEWRGLLERQPFPIPANPLLEGTHPGVLTLEVSGQNISLTLEAGSSNPGKPIAHVALLGTGIENYITRGENADRTLRHDFVVLQHELKQGDGPWRFDVAADKRATAIAAWIEDANTQRPIQAVGGWLDGRGNEEVAALVP